MTDVACTIVAKPELAHARVLAASWARQHPEVPFVVALADEPDGHFDAGAEPYEVVRLAALPFRGNAALRFRHPRLRLTYAATPFVLEHLLDRGHERVLFFKQESLVTARHDRSFTALDEHAIVLTPHLLEPATGPDAEARERDVALAGAFNLGFLGVSAGARPFLRWWQDRLREHCEHDVERGLHFEQRWIDLVPGLFDGVHVDRDPGANVGHWNLAERAVTLDGDDVRAAGRPCRLFRFSGYDPDDPQALTRYHARLDRAAAGAAGAMFARYHAAIMAAGHEQARRWPWAWDAFDDGVPVVAAVRELHAGLGEQAATFGDPFRTGPGSFREWLAGPDEDEPALTRLWATLRRQRPDVAAAYPEPSGADRLGFLGWATTTGHLEHGIPDGHPVLSG